MTEFRCFILDVSPVEVPVLSNGRYENIDNIAVTNNAPPPAVSESVKQQEQQQTEDDGAYENEEYSAKFIEMYNRTIGHGLRARAMYDYQAGENCVCLS